MGKMREFAGHWLESELVHCSGQTQGTEELHAVPDAQTSHFAAAGTCPSESGVSRACPRLPGGPVNQGKVFQSHHKY